MRKIAWMIVMMLAVTMVFAACGAKEEPKDTQVSTTDTVNKTDEAKADEMKSDPVSDWIKVNSYAYKLLETNVVDGYKIGGVTMGEEAGNVYIWVKFAVRNEGSEKAIFSSILSDAKLVSPDAVEYPAEIIADNVLNDTEFVGGKENTGEWYFKVPGKSDTTVSGWKLVMKTPDILSDAKAELMIP